MNDHMPSIALPLAEALHHDMMGAISAVQGFSGLFDVDSKLASRMIDYGTCELNCLTENMLDYAKAAEGMLKPQSETMTAQKCVQQVIERMAAPAVAAH